MANSCPLSNTPKPISIDDNIILRKDDDGTSLVAIINILLFILRLCLSMLYLTWEDPKLVWVPSKSGWMCIGTIGIGGLIQLFSYCSSCVESNYEA
jgi:hypothetical protein